MSVVIPLPLEHKCVTRAKNSGLNSNVQKICKQVKAIRRQLEEQDLGNLIQEERIMFFSKQKNGYSRNIALYEIIKGCHYSPNGG